MTHNVQNKNTYAIRICLSLRTAGVLGDDIHIFSRRKYLNSLSSDSDSDNDELLMSSHGYGYISFSVGVCMRVYVFSSILYIPLSFVDSSCPKEDCWTVVWSMFV